MWHFDFFSVYSVKVVEETSNPVNLLSDLSSFPFHDENPRIVR